MDSTPTPRITQAERLNGGIIVTFDDGKCAVYSASLLYANLEHAVLLDEAAEDHPEIARS